MFKKLSLSLLSLVLVFSLFGGLALAKGGKPKDDFVGLVDVGGYSLYVEVTGKRQKGSPTVILENGYGSTHDQWDAVVAELSKITQVVSYDRANVGQSEAPTTGGFTAKDAATRLNIMLKKVKVNGPIIIVAHSIGGLYAREYAHMYPTKVKGIVFVDSSHENMADVMFAEFPEEVKDMIMEGDLAYFNYVEGTLADTKQTNQQIEQTVEADSLRRIPITVLTGGNHGYPDTMPVSPQELENRWNSLQVNIASLSNKSVHLVNAEHGHIMHITDPQFVVNAVKAHLGKKNK